MPDAGYRKRRPQWTREEIIAAIQKWVAEHGEIPSATDWNPSDCRNAARRSTDRASRWVQRITRFDSGEYPWTGSVSKKFGSWNEAIRAAGFDPRPANQEHKAPSYARQRTLDDLSRTLTQARQETDPQARQLALYDLADAALQIAAELEAA